MQLPDADPQFYEEGHEFVDVDVVQVGVDSDFFVLAEVLIASWKTAVEEILAGETPFMVQSLAVSTHAIKRGIGSCDEGGFPGDDESDWLVPHVVIEVGVQGGAETAEVGHDV